jgi:hypothetical protein
MVMSKLSPAAEVYKQSEFTRRGVKPRNTHCTVHNCDCSECYNDCTCRQCCIYGDYIIERDFENRMMYDYIFGPMYIPAYCACCNPCVSHENGNK